jgi:hypothetical protein
VVAYFNIWNHLDKTVFRQIISLSRKILYVSFLCIHHKDNVKVLLVSFFIYLRQREFSKDTYCKLLYVYIIKVIFEVLLVSTTKLIY